MAGNAKLAALDLSRASQLVQIKSFDTPTRYYDALQITLEQRPTKKSLLKASYTYSQNQGNYPGLFSTETNQLDPNITSEYDLKNLMANRYGPLGLDRPHLLKVDGFYEFDLKQAGLITAGASFRVQSGLAHNTLGADYLYGASESYLLPRGSEERSPTTWELDVHLSYGRKLSKTTKLEVFTNIFNLTDNQGELTADETYTFDNANPIVGGDKSDLAHIKATDSNGNQTDHSVVVNPNFLKTTAHQAPLSAQFGVRLSF